MALVFPAYLSSWTTKKVREAGVDVKTSKSATKFTPREGGGVDIHLQNGEVISADHVVTSIGIEPNVELAKSGNLEIDQINGGIVVNAELEARRNVFSVIISFYSF